VATPLGTEPHTRSPGAPRPQTFEEYSWLDDDTLVAPVVPPRLSCRMVTDVLRLIVGADV
jgi:hypothetical protein